MIRAIVIGALFGALVAYQPAASADLFADIETAHNSGAPMADLLAPRYAERWERGFADDRGRARITRAAWSHQKPNMGLARWYVEQGAQRQYGWLIVEKGDDGARWWYEGRGPSHINTAVAGQGADSASTAVALSQGFVEANPVMAPLGGPAMAALKIGGTLAIQKYASTEHCIDFSEVAGPMGAAAGGWNLAVLAGAGPVALIPAIAVGVAANELGEPALWRCVPKDLRQIAAQWRSN